MKEQEEEEEKERRGLGILVGEDGVMDRTNPSRVPPIGEQAGRERKRRGMKERVQYRVRE